MADHRANDLSYGHLGEATYDAEDNQWGFSVETSHSHSFQQVLPFTRNQPPSIRIVPETKENNSYNSAAREQRKWLSRARPETVPAYPISSTYSRSSLKLTESSVPTGQLLALGAAVDESRMPAYRTEPIIAMPYGEAGNVLRLLRPRIENYGWGIQSSVRLPLMNASIAEKGHWVGTGGRIYQVVFAEDGKFSSTWLAVRQLSVITIFRPMYHISHTPAFKPDTFGVSFPPSHISANPVALLNAQQCGSKSFIDLSFNPYYPRQFAVIDEAGFWCIWDIEGRKSLTLAAGKQGTVKNETMTQTASNEEEITDGWHRIVWLTNVSTIAVCDRRSLVVFDITATPKRLRTHRLFLPSSSDWILDIKRSAIHSDHLYVLTSSRIFWLKIIAFDEGKKHVSSGAKLILSYRHYRDPNDNTMSLEVLTDNDVSVLIMSQKSLLVNYYKFSMNSSGPTSSHGSLITHHHMTSVELKSLLFLQVALIPRLSRVPGPELEYIERGVRFYQAWSLASNLEISSALYTIHDLNTRESAYPMHRITAPQRRIPQARRREASQRVKSHFIVADGDLYEEGSPLDALQSEKSYVDFMNTGDSLERRINWLELYRQVFSVPSESSETEQFMKQLETRILKYAYRGEEKKEASMSTLLELSQLPSFYKDLEQANIYEVLDKISNEDDNRLQFSLVVSNLTLCPGSKTPLTGNLKPPNFIDVYDRLVGQWIQSLPRDISNQARLTIFNITRKVAVEICLSAIAISYRDRSADPKRISIENEESILPTSEASEEITQVLPSSQITAESLHDSGFGLPTPAQTPSLHSGGSVTSTDAVEDPAVLRLRQYAISMDYPQDANDWTPLSRWSPTPGVDPMNYRWKPTQQASTAEEEAEYKRDQKKRREEARRKRKTEIFLTEDVGTATKVAGSATLASYGSQPDNAHHATSSQVVNEISMTQPSRGVFGSRSTKDAKRKQRRRNAGF